MEHKHANMTVADVADYLRISEYTVREMARKKYFRHSQLEGSTASGWMT